MLTDCSQCVTGDRAFLAFLAPPGGVLHTHIQRGLAAPDWLTGAAEYIHTYLRVRGWGGGAHELVDTKIGDQLRLQVAHRKVAVPVRDCSTMPRILSRLIIIIIIPHQGGEGGKGRKAPRSLLGILRGVVLPAPNGRRGPRWVARRLRGAGRHRQGRGRSWSGAQQAGRAPLCDQCAARVAAGAALHPCAGYHLQAHWRDPDGPGAAL